MAIRVLHVLESLEPDAGSGAISLRGLHSELQSAGAESIAVSSAAEAANALGSANMVHIHGWDYDLARSVARQARTRRTPYVLSPHGLLTCGSDRQQGWMGKLRTAWRDRRIVRGAACVTALNEREETELRAVDLHRNIRQLAYGLRLADYEGPQATGAGPRSLPKGRFVLMLGPIDPRTGCVALLKAFAEIGPDANGWHVVLAGRDGSPHRRSLEAAVYRKGGEGRVVFAAAPDLVTQRAWLARACLLAAPSLHVRFPASILQAVAAGVPVLATTPATPPGLENVVTTCGATREELREALRSVLRWSDEKRAASTDEARASGRTRLDWSLVAREYADLYTALAERS